MSSLPYQWTGDGFAPLRPRLSDKELVVGETYWLDPEQPRSVASHRHQFAWLREAWLQLPEKLVEQFPTSEHLRKRALIDAGFYDEQITDCGTNAAALRVASMLRSIDDFAYVVVRGPLVVRRTAKSQSVRAMGAKEFQASKDRVMEIVAGLIGVAPDELAKEAGRNAA